MTSFVQREMTAGRPVGVGETDERLAPGAERRVEIALPASPAFVRTVRMVAASVGAVAGLGVAALDDLRVAVDEACAWLLAHAAGPTLWVDFELHAGAVTVCGGMRSEADEHREVVMHEPVSELRFDLDELMGEATGRLSEGLLRVVADSYRLECGSSWARFELTKRRAES